MEKTRNVTTSHRCDSTSRVVVVSTPSWVLALTKAVAHTDLQAITNTLMCYSRLQFQVATLSAVLEKSVTRGQDTLKVGPNEALSHRYRHRHPTYSESA